MALISVTDARALVLGGLQPLGIEMVPLSHARGRVLAKTLASTLTQPPFDASAMDGYAVRIADLSTLPARLALVGESAAGDRFDGIVQRGQAVRIFTGAPIPDGADTIVIQEDTEAIHDATGSSVLVKEAVSGRHIRPRGQDFKAGDVLLEAGTRLGARALMLAAAMNHAELPVWRKPKVAILSTGDEVVPPGSKLGADEIVASVSYGIAALVEAQGGEAQHLGIARDDAASIGACVKKSSEADILVTIGGASVGERDLVKGALADEGLKLDFAKVAMRPGKPVFSGRLGRPGTPSARRVLGLPGNPVSALVCAFVFLIPMLRTMLGGRLEDSVPEEAILASALPKNGPREHFMRGCSTFSREGIRHVQPVPSQDSSLIAAFAEADCLILNPAGAASQPEGARVKVLPLFD